MDVFTNKRTAGGLGIAKRGSSLSVRDSKHEDKSICRDSKQENKSIICFNRIGCNTRLKSMKGTQIGNPDKAKCLRPSFQSSSGKAIVGSSSKPFSGKGDLRNPHKARQNQAPHKRTVLSQISSTQGETEVSELAPLTAVVLTEHPQNEHTESTVRQCFSVNTEEEVGSCNMTSSLGTQKQVNQQSRLRSRESSLGSSVQNSFFSRNTGQAANSVTPGQGSNAHRYHLRNLSCDSISDFHPSGHSVSDSGHKRRSNVVKKRCSSSSTNGGSSSSITKGMTRSSTGGNSVSQRNNAFSSLSFSESSSSQQAFRKARNWSAGSNGGTSVKTQRTSSADTRTREAEHVNDNCSALTDPVTVQQLPQTEILVRESTPVSSSQSFATEHRPIYRNSYRQLDSSSETVHSRPTSRSGDRSTRALHQHGLSVDRDNFRYINMNGNAEVLFELERIEQDEELTYERLLALETNLLLDGGFHDQHRDMRLDIDNMSYEELLALGEKMGTVSTALTEEALLKCLKRSCYTPSALHPGLAGCENDVKCSICQEEYQAGDEMGKLDCEHRYHEDCIHQWLRLKNWCPICKASVSSS